MFKTADKVTQKQTNTLKSVFGPFPASVATKTCTVVNKITCTLPDDVIQLLGNQEREEADGEATVTEFGQSLRFVHQKPIVKDGEISSSDSEDEDRQMEVDLNYKKSMQASGGKQEVKTGCGQNIDAGWLQQEVAKYYGGSDSTALGMTLEDFASTIFDVLSSPKSDSELQNDVSVFFLNFTLT